MAGERVVWILGAGFSRPLGGPLLGDFFSEGGLTRLRAAYAVKYPWLKHAVSLKLLLGKGLEAGAWSDAEELLDALDTAALSDPGTPSRRLVDRFVEEAFDEGIEQDVRNVAKFARYVLTAQCTAFLEGNNPRTERWQPFREWLKGLGDQDTVITFNYDMVISMLIENAHAGGAVWVPLPTELGNGLVRARVLKLHGSVDWHFKDGAVLRHTGHPLGDQTLQHAIAGPGPSKLRNSENEFAPLWEAAVAAITEANAVVFVGYRFPPSDANARSRILSALRSNSALTAGQRFVNVHTVLGPNLHEPDQVRMKALVHGALRHGHRIDMDGRLPMTANPEQGFFRVHQHPLFAQDFFTVVGRERLLQTSWD